MFSRKIALGAALAVLTPLSALAETHEVQMLNRLDRDVMVFEPSALRIAPGDTVRFVPTDRGHNAETVEGMIPEGAEPFAGRIGEEIEVTFTQEGYYGIKCKPHFAMGMVMIVQVGEGEAPADFLEGRIPPRTKQRFEGLLDALSAE